MNEFNDETTEKLLLNLQVECLLASANCATHNFDSYLDGFAKTSALDVKKNAAEVLRAMFGKVETITSTVANEYRNILNGPNRERIDALKSWSKQAEETANEAKSFLDRFDSIEASRKKIEAVCDRLGTVKAFFDGRKHEQLLKDDWELVKIREQLESAVAISLELMRLIGKEEK